jgi:hypothetical protein
MPIQEVLDDEGQPSEADRVLEALEQHAAKVREVTITRMGRRGAQLQRWIVKLDDDDDKPKLLRELAESVVDVAERDSGETARRYTVALLGEALMRANTPVLVSLVIKASGDEKAPKAGDVASTLARDVGERHLKLLDVTLKSLERIAPIAAIGEERERAASAADAQVKIHVANLEAADRREQREAKSSAELQGFILGMSQTYGKLIDAVATYTRAKADKIIHDLREQKTPRPRARKKKAKARARKAAAT